MYGTARLTAGYMAQILDLIKADHDFIRGIIDELVGNPEIWDIRRVTLRRELSGHMHAEEATLYARLRGDVPEDIDRSIREHDDVRDMLARFETISFRDRAWMSALAELRDLVEAHFSAEEGEIFSYAMHYFSRSELFELSEEFEVEKRRSAEATMV